MTTRPDEEASRLDLERDLRGVCRAFAHFLYTVHRLQGLDRETLGQVEELARASFLEAEDALGLKGMQKVRLNGFQATVIAEWLCLSK
ncbi:MAG: hypothetical protein OXQ84_06060 [bacterium]|nr:hypothetical protein [bacterium]